MTFAPATIVELGRYWTSKGGVNLGIVGDAAHRASGGYHEGRDDLVAAGRLAIDYSVKTARDKAGLSNAASAIDLGRLNGSLTELQAFSKWFVARCRANAPGTSDVREFIYSPDGTAVLRWDRERGYSRAPRTGEADISHRTHSHLSFYRDAEGRSKVGLFTPYFEEADMGVQIKLASTATTATPWTSFGTAKTAKACQSFAIGTGDMTGWQAGADLGVVELGELRQALGPWPVGTPIVVTNVNGIQSGFIKAEVTFTAIKPPVPAPPPDTTPFDQDDIDLAVKTEHDRWLAWLVEHPAP